MNKNDGRQALNKLVTGTWADNHMVARAHSSAGDVCEAHASFDELIIIKKKKLEIKEWKTRKKTTVLSVVEECRRFSSPFTFVLSKK